VEGVREKQPSGFPGSVRSDMMEEVGEERPWFEERPRTPDLETVGEEFVLRSVLVG
jgi:hypothetical protein